MGCGTGGVHCSIAAACLRCDALAEGACPDRSTTAFPARTRRRPRHHRATLAFHIESLREYGEPAPEPRCTATVVEVAAVAG